MGSGNMDARLSDFVKKHYPDSKSDLFAVFIERCGQMTGKNRYQAMITQHAWMFLSSFEKLRGKLLLKDTVNMAHLGPRAFEEIGGEVVQTTSFVLRNSHIADYKGTYCRLIEPTTQQGKEKMFLSEVNRYIISNNQYNLTPKLRYIYWVGSNELWKHECVSTSLISGGRNKTHNNEKYVRCSWEIVRSNKWVLYMNGGNYRKWYGNLLEVVDWSDDAQQEYAKHGGLVDKNNVKAYGISWNGICGDLYGFRIKPKGIPFSSSSPTIVTRTDEPPCAVLGMLNSKVGHEILSALNPTLQLNVGEVLDSPLVLPENPDKILDLTHRNIELSANDWDSYETSWDFQQHPLVRWSRELWDATAIGAQMSYYYGSHPEVNSPLELCFLLWRSECNERFKQLKENEEELNRIFVDIYGLRDELTPEVADKGVTVHRIFDTKDDVPESMQGSNYVRTKRDEIVSLLSYAVGCMFGRYSLDTDGLAYAGGDWDDGKYKTFLPDRDGILPITDEEYLEDDIVSRLCGWLKAAYGEDTLGENLDFIAGALGGKGSTSREIIRNYFLKDFFKDHCKTYQKRPIYWLFDSGKQNGFKALIYLHRYTLNTIGNLRVDYLHKMQRVYESEINRMQDMIDHSTNAREVAASAKRKEKLQKQLKECRDYDEMIAHLALSRIELDLDDGVKVNYEKIQTASDGKKYAVLAKI